MWSAAKRLGVRRVHSVSKKRTCLYYPRTVLLSTHGNNTNSPGVELLVLLIANHVLPHASEEIVSAFTDYEVHYPSWDKHDFLH